jgi:hypothetical protein
MAKNEDMLCTRCGSVARPKVIVPGTFALEIILWVLFILPGLAYTLHRLASKYTACPLCGEPHMIPLSTPRARAMTAALSRR